MNVRCHSPDLFTILAILEANGGAANTSSDMVSTTSFPNKILQHLKIKRRINWYFRKSCKLQIGLLLKRYLITVCMCYCVCVFVYVCVVCILPTVVWIIWKCLDYCTFGMAIPSPVGVVCVRLFWIHSRTGNLSIAELSLSLYFAHSFSVCTCCVLCVRMGVSEWMNEWMSEWVNVSSVCMYVCRASMNVVAVKQYKTYFSPNIKGIRARRG